MKTTLLVLALVLSTSVLADTKIDTSTCTHLQSEVTVHVFKGIAISGLLKASDADSRRSIDYLDTVNHTLNSDLSFYCANTDKITIESLIKKHGDLCEKKCHDSGKDMKTKPSFLSGNGLSEADKAFQVCTKLCGQGEIILNTFKMGADIASKAKGTNSPDCSGAVADSGRSKVKVITIDIDKINAENKKKAAQK